MKAWEDAEIIEISFEDTAHGGYRIDHIDEKWKDDAGYAHCWFS